VGKPDCPSIGHVEVICDCSQYQRRECMTARSTDAIPSRAASDPAAACRIFG
jgi:hypothetical protein